MRRILSLLVENEPGTLARAAGLFSARNYNIESLTVAPTEDITLSRMTIVTSGDDGVIEQITKQVNKLIEVFKVIDITNARHLERELMLVKVRADGARREEMKRLADIFRASIVDVTPQTFIIQVTGDGDKLDAFIRAAGESNIIETARTGVSAIVRGEEGMKKKGN